LFLRLFRFGYVRHLLRALAHASPALCGADKVVLIDLEATPCARPYGYARRGFTGVHEVNAPLSIIYTPVGIGERVRPRRGPTNSTRGGSKMLVDTPGHRTTRHGVRAARPCRRTQRFYDHDITATCRRAGAVLRHRPPDTNDEQGNRHDR
jgi:hypothetical protein